MEDPLTFYSLRSSSSLASKGFRPCHRPRGPALKTYHPSRTTKAPLSSRVRQSVSLVGFKDVSSSSSVGVNSRSNVNINLPPTVSLPLIQSETVVKQVSYHWKTVQKMTLKSQQKSCSEIGTQTEQIEEQKKMKTKQRLESSLSTMTSTFRNSFRYKANSLTRKAGAATAHRPGSILEQAEALKPKSAIKSQVIQEISRRASIGNAFTTISKTFLSQDSSEDPEVKQKEGRQNSKVLTSMSTSISLPSRRNFLNPNNESRRASETEIEKVNSNSDLSKSCEKVVETIRKKNQLRRSNTTIEMSQQSKLSDIIHRRLKFMVSNDPDSKKKKDLEKMWQKTYIGMCNRAVVLNHAILKAEHDEATIKPVSLSDIKHSHGPVKSQSVDKHFIGLGHQFYNVHEIGEAESSLEELDLGSPVANKRRVRQPRMVPRLQLGFKTIMREVAFTEEVDLTHSEKSRFLVRHNLRSRSVHVHKMPVTFSSIQNSEENSIQTKSQASLTTSACSLLSLESLFYRKNQKSDSNEFRPALSRKNSGILRQKEKSLTKNEPRSVDESKSIVNSCRLPVEKSRNLFAIKPRLKVDVSTQVNFEFFSRSESPEARPVERAIEARTGSEDGLGSMVRCLHFAHTYIASREFASFPYLVVEL